MNIKDGLQKVKDWVKRIMRRHIEIKIRANEYQYGLQMSEDNRHDRNEKRLKVQARALQKAILNKTNTLKRPRKATDDDSPEKREVKKVHKKKMKQVKKKEQRAPVKVSK